MSETTRLLGNGVHVRLPQHSSTSASQMRFGPSNKYGINQVIDQESLSQLAAVTRLCCLWGLQVTAAEKAASEPPKLGKHRYEAPGVAVLTSDEVTGSLRQIKVRQ